jgi:hypothetical protein
MGAYSDETHPVLLRYYDYSGGGGGGSYSRRRPGEECTPFCSRLLGICAAIVAALCVLGLMWYGLQSTMPPHYDIVITGVDGHEAGRGGAQPGVQPDRRRRVQEHAARRVHRPYHLGGRAMRGRTRAGATGEGDLYLWTKEIVTVRSVWVMGLS